MIFDAMLRFRGMAKRQAQMELSHKMLDSMLRNQISLCDAGTGIGKTYAYLVASIVYSRHRAKSREAFRPILISTSSIALQTAVKHEYLPLLSSVLLEAEIIRRPILAVVRKGKAHYVCDQRLDQRLRQLRTATNKPREKAALEALRHTLDLDQANKLSDYDRSRVCVPNFCDCTRKSCRYQDFRKQCRSKRYLFQICNHNLFLADVNHRETGRQPLLSDYCALILDESHKLPEAAQETLTTAISTVWNLPVGMVVTSGTLAVNEDFSRFRANADLQHNGRVTESVSPSPFDYFQNCLLYLPAQPPMLVDEKLSDYYDTLTAEITQLIHAAYGHTLVLFTAYSAMSAVAERLEVPYRVFTMWKNGGQALANFKAHPGAILLATGAVWEGIDFPGDCVSLLIIPRLPFAVPDAQKQRQQEAYPNLQAYIQDVVVPEMQIKLRQGFGRAIRTETDTCVIAILDDRAAPEGRYHRATLEALPEMQCTSDLEAISRFMLEHKADQYFKEGKPCHDPMN